MLLIFLYAKVKENILENKTIINILLST